MDPSYQNLLDPSNLIYTLIAYVIHGIVMGIDLAFAGFLIWSGAYALRRPL